MMALRNNKVYLIAAGLIVLMAATRYHHFGSALHLPDASLAVFFLAGLYLRSFWMLPLLMLEAGVSDYFAITHGGVSDWCVTPAYIMLIPTYAVMWYAGRWCSSHYQKHGRLMLPYSVSLLVSTTVAFQLSSGSFYLFSGRFTDQTWAEYGMRIAQYFPPYLMSAFVYAAFALFLHYVITGLVAKQRTGEVM